MKLRSLLLVIVLGVGSTALVIAQSTREASSRDDYLPRLGDIMGVAQWRHIKLWFAGKLLNWDLAAYEVNQIRGSLVDAATLYPGIPVTDVTTMAKPLQSISEAIDTKDSAKFAKAFNELTAGCNSCHREIGRAFIAIQVPAVSPFTNQLFPPQSKQ